LALIKWLGKLSKSLEFKLGALSTSVSRCFDNPTYFYPFDTEYKPRSEYCREENELAILIKNGVE
jgi:hypothetical protein